MMVSGQLHAPAASLRYPLDISLSGPNDLVWALRRTEHFLLLSGIESRVVIPTELSQLYGESATLVLLVLLIVFCFSVCNFH
jgi:hypothetical protein